MSIESLWAPWRLGYVKSGKTSDKCIFCEAPTRDDEHDQDHGIIAYSDHSYIILNRYPYTNGHLLVIPYLHEGEVDRLPQEVQEDLHRMLMQAVSLLKRAYGCPAMNIGMNMGAAAGAGIAAHLHYHVLPRWEGDTNFMPVIGGTKVIPESLDDVYQRLKAAWSDDA